MSIYAQLDGNVVVGVSQLSGEVLADNMIDITNSKERPEIGSTYNAETKTFIPPVPIENFEPQPTLEEMQAQTLLNTEMLLIQKELETEVSL